MPRLKVMVDNMTLREYDLLDEPVFLGRHPDNVIALEDATVSGRHAVITPQPSPYLDDVLEYHFEDLHSTNGCKLNGQICQSATLKNGDYLMLGRQVLCFVDETATDPGRTDIMLPEDTENL